MQQATLFEQTIRVLAGAGALEHLILVGGWVPALYRVHYGTEAQIPAIRTLDIDFLIAPGAKNAVPVDIHGLLKPLGFDLQIGYPEGVERFVHPELELEFLVSAKGRAIERVKRIPSLGINAQPLRYMSILIESLMEVTFSGISILVPRPGAMGLHKLIVSTERRSSTKRNRDITLALSLLRFCCADEERANETRQLFMGLPKGWQRKIRTVLAHLDTETLEWLES